MRLPVLAALLTVAAAPIAPPGDPYAGKALFEQRCAMCHTAESLAGKGCLVVCDMRRVNEKMFPVGLLSDQQVADLAAYLDELAPKRP